MKLQAGTRTLCQISAFTLLVILFMSQSASGVSTNCGTNNNEVCVLTADRIDSRPPSSTISSVPIQKGKRAGLLFRFECVGQTTLSNPKDVCFPIQSSVSTVVQLKIG